MNKKLSTKSVLLIIALFVLLIGGGLAAYYVVYESNFDIRREASGTETEWLDERFGLAGDYDIAQRMGIKWAYNWGWEINNETVYTYKDRGQEALLVIGRPKETPGGCTGDQPQYNGDTPSCGFYDKIPQLAQAFPGGYWAIGNEPDLDVAGAADDFFSSKPHDYAKWYHAFYTEIKKHDPTAKVGIGGLAYPRYAHSTSSLAKPEMLNHEHIQSLISSDPANTEIYQNAAWVILWREAYNNYFEEYPTVDFWNIHIYPKPWSTIGHQAAFEYAKDDITFFRQFMTFIGEGSKPLWVTETAILGCRCDDFSDCNSKAGNNSNYMENFINWMTSTNNVQKWFWFYSGDEGAWADSMRANDILYNSTGELNDLGKKYIALAGVSQDSAPSETPSETPSTDDTTPPVSDDSTPPSCTSLSIVGKQASNGVVTVSDENESITISLKGADSDGTPTDLRLYSAVAGQSDSYYTEVEKGSDGSCIGATNLSRVEGGSITNGELQISTTLKDLRANTPSGSSSDILIMAWIADVGDDGFCSSNPGTIRNNKGLYGGPCGDQNSDCVPDRCGDCDLDSNNCLLTITDTVASTDDTTPPTTTPSDGTVSADLNGDGSVSIADFQIFVSDYTGDYNSRSDLDSDGDIDITDYSLFAQAYADANT